MARLIRTQKEVEGRYEEVWLVVEEDSLDQWPAGVQYVAGLVAQDVQDALFETVGRWPLCHDCDPSAPEHSLFIQPDLGGPDPVWVCEESGDVIAPLGGLAR